MGATLIKEELYSAIESDNTEKTIKILTQYPKYINAVITSDCQTTCLNRAIWRGNLQLVEALIILQADVNFSGPRGITPLMWACKRDHYILMKYLLANGADLYMESPEGFTSIGYSILHGNYQIAAHLYSLDPQPELLKEAQIYRTYADNRKLRWVNYDIFIDNLKNKLLIENCPDHFNKPMPPALKDPVIDPRENWKQTVSRIIQFEDPPLVERESLPTDLQPQNRVLGQLHSYLYGMDPNPKQKTETIPLDPEDQENFKEQTKEREKPKDYFTSLHGEQNRSFTNLQARDSQRDKNEHNDPNQTQEILIEMEQQNEKKEIPIIE